jgi:glucose dehydrogenase
MIKNILTMKTRNQTCSKNYPLLFISFLIIIASCADDPGTLPVSESVVNTERIMAAADEPGNWLTHGGTYNELRFSELDQINRENVDRTGLEL